MTGTAVMESKVSVRTHDEEWPMAVAGGITAGQAAVRLDDGRSIPVLAQFIDSWRENDGHTRRAAYGERTTGRQAE
jgi:hypothetical protein